MAFLGCGLAGEETQQWALGGAHPTEECLALTCSSCKALREMNACFVESKQSWAELGVQPSSSGDMPGC